MNIVFWALIVLALIFLWFSLSHLFKDVGEWGLNLYHKAKEEMADDDEQDENKSDETKEINNER